MQIAVLIPTYKRSNKIKQIVDNFQKCSSKSALYFVITPDDTSSRTELDKLNQQYFIVDGEYRSAINEGFRQTSEPFIFCGADDIEFTPGWDSKLLKVMEDKTINVTGGVDDWPCSKSGVHISHPLIRRTYIETDGGPLGYPGEVYNPQMNHYQIDIELEQVAWSRGCIKVCPDCVIHHNHFVNHKAQHDGTYKRSFKLMEHDTKVYDSIKHKFEFWDVDALQHGIAEPSQYRMKKLSVIMPIWNCKDYTLRTLESLLKNTKHPYELILIDDHSTEFDGETLLAEMRKKAQGTFLKITTIVNDKQQYCNANWNKGVEVATGDYIAIINSDIDFLTDEWDDFLIENLDFGYDLVNPFQCDRVYTGPYMKPPYDDPASRYNIRGACFMMSSAFAKKIFPIPKRYVHWCGDNYISAHAQTYLYDIRVSIFHHISKSGEKVDQRLFWQMVTKDVENYIEDTSEDMSLILSNCKKRVAAYGK